ncbi:MAG: peptidoglycan-binding domain-containing protein [Pseudomonadota bacterium]
MRFLFAFILLASLAAQAAGQDSLPYRIETFLAELGFSPGAVDGQVDSATTNAIAAYQRSRGYPVSGGMTLAEYQQLERDILAHRTRQLPARRPPAGHASIQVTRHGGEIDWKWFSNMNRRGLNCPDPLVIDIRFKTPERRPWTRQKVKRAMDLAIQFTEPHLRRCKGTSSRFIISADGKIVFDEENVEDVRDPLFKEERVTELFRALFESAGGDISDFPFLAYSNGALFDDIMSGRYAPQAAPWRTQTRVKNFFIIYHNVFFNTCLKPTAPADAVELLRVQRQAKMYGGIRRESTTTNARTGEVINEAAWNSIDVQPEFVQTYLGVINDDGFPTTLKRMSDYERRTVYSHLVRDAERLVDNLGCVGYEIDAFEKALAEAAAPKLTFKPGESPLSALIQK